jgi:carbon storage regulator
MDILSLSFEEPLMISIGERIVKLIPYKTPEPGNIKFGIVAPLSINIHREEIYKAIQTKQHLDEVE